MMSKSELQYKENLRWRQALDNVKTIYKEKKRSLSTDDET